MPIDSPRAKDIFASCDAVFFDIDGTLVDSNEFHVVAWDLAFRNGGRSVARHRLRDQIGKGSDILIPSLFPGIGKDEQKSLSDAHGDIFKSQFLNLVRPFPFAADLIHALHARMKVLLVSSSDKNDVEYYAHLLAVENQLYGMVSFDDVEQTKPAADLFAVALKKARVDGKDAMTVGDTPYDVAAAAKCGVRSIALRSGGFTDEQLNANGPLALFTDIGVLFSAL